MYARIRSRHGTHAAIKGTIPCNVRTVVRLGSTTPLTEVFPNATKNKKRIVEINTVDAVKVSANKLLMKQKFSVENVKTADWWQIRTSAGAGLVAVNTPILDVEADVPTISVKDLPFPIVAKHIYGSRGTGNYLLNNKEELEAWVKNKDLSKYIFEKFYDYCREYRLHVTKDGCFYTCRKMLKGEIPEGKRWFRNDSNSVWIVESNEKFDKPVNWKDIEQECVKALNAVGLDVGAFDVRVQSAKNKKGKQREQPEFIVIESNSAPSFGDITAEKYKQILPALIESKIKS